MWVSVLEMAEAWGTPPWEIAQGRTPRIVWMFRQQALNKGRNRYQNYLSKKK